MKMRTVWNTTLLCFILSIPVFGNEFTVTNTPGSILEFTTVDVGIPGIDPLYAGSTIYTSSNTFQLKAGGTDIGGTGDAFQFAYLYCTGDFDVRVRIINLEASDPYAKAGLVIRNSTNAADAGIYYMVTPAYNETQLFCGYRSTTGGTLEILSPDSDAQLPPATFPNVWLRIRRQGDNVFMYRSTDGLSWAREYSITGTETVINTTLLVGLGLTAHDNAPNHYAECEAYGFSLSFLCTCLPIPALYEAMVGNALILSWDAKAGLNYQLMESPDLVHWTVSDATIEVNWNTGTFFTRVAPIGTKFYQLQE